MPVGLCSLRHTSLSWADSTFVGQYPMALAPLTPWGLQCYPGFTLIAPQNGISGPPCRDTLTTCLASVVFLNLGERFQTPLFITLKPEPYEWWCYIRQWEQESLPWIRWGPTSEAALWMTYSCLHSYIHKDKKVKKKSSKWSDIGSIRSDHSLVIHL